MIKLIILSIFSCTIVFSGVVKTTKPITPKVPIEELAKGIDFELFGREFEVSGKIEYCKSSGVLKGVKLPGVMTHMIEPVAFVEAVSKDWYFKTINVELKKTVKGYDIPLGSTRGSGIQTAYHYIKFPLMSMIFGDAYGTLCFEKGSIDFGYLSEADPVSNIPGVKLRMFADMVQLFTPQGLVSAVFDCAATVAANYEDVPSKASSKIRNGFYFNCGCTGITGISQREGSTQDPYTSAVAAVCGTINLMSYSGLLKKSAQYGIGGPDTSCSAKYFPRIMKTQWKLQPFYPYILPSIELGLTGLMWNTFATPTTENDDAVFLVWKRRDFAMGSYACN